MLAFDSSPSVVQEEAGGEAGAFERFKTFAIETLAGVRDQLLAAGAQQDLLDLSFTTVVYENSAVGYPFLGKVDVCVQRDHRVFKSFATDNEVELVFNQLDESLFRKINDIDGDATIAVAPEAALAMARRAIECHPATYTNSDGGQSSVPTAVVVFSAGQGLIDPIREELKTPFYSNGGEVSAAFL